MAKNKSIPPMLPHIEALETYEGVDPMEAVSYTHLTLPTILLV